MIFNKKLILFYFSFVLVGLLSAKDAIIRDYSLSWVEYNKYTDSYIPLIELNKKHHNFNLYIDLNENENYCLKFSAEKNTEIFFNQQYFSRVDTAGVCYIDLKDIPKDILAKKVLVTFYNKVQFRLPKDIALVKKEHLSDDSDTKYTLMKRFKSPFSNLILIGIILVFVFISLLKSADSERLNAFFNPSKMFTHRDVEEYVYLNVFSLNTLPYLIVGALIISVYLLSNGMSFFGLDDLTKRETFGEISGAIFYNFFIVLMLLVLKYVFLFVLSFFVETKKFINRQYFEFVRISIIVFSLLLMVSSVKQMGDLGHTIVVFFTIGLSVFWFLRMGFISYQKLEFRKVYLICYLCTSELVPLVIILKSIQTF